MALTVYYLQEMASSKSLMNLLTFTFGSAIGFFICYLLFSIILEEEVKIQPHILHNDPHGQHSADSDNNQLQGQMNFNADSGQHKGILLHLTIYNMLPFHALQNVAFFTAKNLYESFSFTFPMFR